MVVQGAAHPIEEPVPSDWSPAQQSCAFACLNLQDDCCPSMAMLPDNFVDDNDQQFELLLASRQQDAHFRRLPGQGIVSRQSTVLFFQPHDQPAVSVLLDSVMMRCIGQHGTISMVS